MKYEHAPPSKNDTERLAAESTKETHAPSPENVIATIRQLPREERRRAIQEYREFAACQREIFTTAFGEIVTYLEQYPDAPDDTLHTWLEDHIVAAKASEEQAVSLRDLLTRFLTRRNAIFHMMHIYPEADKLFVRLFDGRPAGDVEIIATPIMIYVRCFNEQDYQKACLHAFGRDDAELREFLKLTSGFALLLPNVTSLYDSVAIENATNSTPAIAQEAGTIAPFHSLSVLPLESRETAIHEQAHITHRILGSDTTRGEGLGTTTNPLLQAAREWRRKNADRRIATEILAYLSEGKSRDEIEKIVPGSPNQASSLYHYLNEKALETLFDLLIEYGATLKPNDESDELRTRAAETITTIEREYYDETHGALDATEHLSGFFSANEITAMLVRADMSLWPRIAKEQLRLVELAQNKSSSPQT